MNIDQVVGRRKVRVTPDFLRHARKCCICRHPRREEIESDYLFWRNPRQIIEYELVHHAAIYRHAHATGLAGIGFLSTALMILYDRIVKPVAAEAPEA